MANFAVSGGLVAEPVETLEDPNVAVDEVIAHEVASGQRPPTLRFWDWDSPLVVIDSFQSVRNEVDSEAAAENGIGVVRRVSAEARCSWSLGNASHFR